MVVSSAMVAIGQGSTDTGTLSVSVLPAGGELTIVPHEGPDSIADLGSTSSAVGLVAPMPTALPVTVSASLRVPDGMDVEAASGTASTFITVSDDRGTGAGWSVVIGAGDGPAWDPVLEENDPSTITRLVPAPELGPMPYDDVSVGGTVSGLSHPTTILQAGQGEGSGMFVQTLAISWPESGDGPGLVTVQLPSAP